MTKPEPKKNYVLELKKAMMKKHAAAHPDAKPGDLLEKSKPNKTPAASNKPQKKVTGRGR